MDSDDVRVRAVVRGRVQMVGFRAFVVSHAGDAGLSGTVRNLPDGTVEVLLEGPAAAVERLVDLLHQGPSYAHVERVDVAYASPSGKLPAMIVAS
jgi:acylphosphatase